MRISDWSSDVCSSDLLIADLAKQYSLDQMRVTHSQNIVLPYVKKSDTYTLWQKLDAAGLAPANLDLISDIIPCPGLDYCSLANARSIPVAQKTSQRLAAPPRQQNAQASGRERVWQEE